MKAMSVLVVLICLVSSLGGAPSQEEAQSSAEKWLSLVDARQYEVSWKESSSVFRSQVMEQDWVKMLQKVRDPLGPLISRKLLSVTLTKSLPGVPDGEYAVLQFQSSFKTKRKVWKRSPSFPKISGRPPDISSDKP